MQWSTNSSTRMHDDAISSLSLFLTRRLNLDGELVESKRSKRQGPCCSGADHPSYLCCLARGRAMTLLVVAWPSREINIQRETRAETTKTTTTTARSSHTHTPFLSDTHSREEEVGAQGGGDLTSTPAEVYTGAPRVYCL